MEYPLCELTQEEFEKHGCSYWRTTADGKRVCIGSPCAEFFRKRLAAVEAERDEMRKQMLEELGCADILEKRVGELEEMLGGDVKTEYVTGRRIDETHVVYYESKSETAEEAKRGIPPNNPNYFVAMRKVTPYVEVKV